MSGYAGESVELTFTGTNFGPTTASGVAPPTVVMVGDVECTGVTVVSGTELTCTVVPTLSGAVDAVVYIDRRPATSARNADGLEFSGFGDAGAFEWTSTMYEASESSSFMEIAVRRPTTLVHPSPAVVYVSSADGEGETGAISADTLTHTAYFKSFIGAELVFGANVFEVRRNVSLTSRYDASCQTGAFTRVASGATACDGDSRTARFQPYPRVGADDDRYLSVNIVNTWSRHGTSSTAAATAVGWIRASCLTVSDKCGMAVNSDALTFSHQNADGSETVSMSAPPDNYPYAFQYV